jgi:hypothetical protein
MFAYIYMYVTSPVTKAVKKLHYENGTSYIKKLQKYNYSLIIIVSTLFVSFRSVINEEHYVPFDLTL